MNNPMEMLKAIRNPQQFVLNIMKNNSNPILKNLVEMAEKNDIKGIEEFGRNLYKQNNRDFDKELNDFMNTFKG